MRYLKTNEAATLLEIAPNTLRMWERRFEFPRPQRSAGGHRSYTHGEVAALREALQSGLSISAAVARARDDVAADANSLVRALRAYDRDRADRAIETALVLRSVERSVEEVLLSSLEEIAGRNGLDSATWAFAARWAAEWLQRAARLVTLSRGRLAVVLAHASRHELDPDVPYIRALELFCIRAGVRVLSLPAGAVSGIGDAASVYCPDLVVLAGGQLDDDTIARWAYLVARSVGARPLALYRPASIRDSGIVLPSAPGEAQVRVIELADAAIPASVGQLTRTRQRIRAA